MRSYVVMGYKFISGEYNGRPWSKVRLFLTSDEKTDEGTACEVVSAPVSSADGIGVGDTVEILYNRFGKVADIRRVV